MITPIITIVIIIITSQANLVMHSGVDIHFIHIATIKFFFEILSKDLLSTSI